MARKRKTPETPSNDASDRLREAAKAAIEASELEYEQDAEGSSHVVRVTVGVDEWLALMRTTLAAREDEERAES
jgi:hypothetical protein